MIFLQNGSLRFPILLGFGIWLFLRLLATDPVLAFLVPYSNIERIVFDSKREVFRSLKKNMEASEPKPYAIIFGTSKSSAFEPDWIRNSLRDPELLVFSFNVPLGCPSYHAYWWEKIKELAEKSGREPTFVLIETDVFQFGERSVYFTLENSYDIRFILKGLGRRILDSNHPGWSLEEASFYLARLLFPIYSYTISTKGISENLKIFDSTDGKKDRAVFLKAKFRKDFLEKTVFLGGSYPNLYIGNHSDSALNQQGAEGISRYFAAYTPLRAQFLYYQELMNDFREKRIPTVVYWPVFPESFAAELDRLPNTSETKHMLIDYVTDLRIENPDWNLKLADPQAEGRLSCRAFADVYHLSGGCFPELSSYIFEEVYSKK